MAYSRSRAISLQAATIGEVLGIAGFMPILAQLTFAQRQKLQRYLDAVVVDPVVRNESIVLTLTIPEVCPVAADVAAARCSRTSRISAAKDAPTGVSRTERLARVISCTPR